MTVAKGVVRREVYANGKVKRYRLANGYFIDGSQSPHHQYHNYRYSIWAPGMGPGGIAAFRGGASTLAKAVDEAFRINPQRSQS
jgi:hypothetical protein